MKKVEIIKSEDQQKFEIMKQMEVNIHRMQSPRELHKVLLNPNRKVTLEITKINIP